MWDCADELLEQLICSCTLGLLCHRWWLLSRNCKDKLNLKHVFIDYTHTGKAGKTPAQPRVCRGCKLMLVCVFQHIPHTAAPCGAASHFPPHWQGAGKSQSWAGQAAGPATPPRAAGVPTLTEVQKWRLCLPDSLRPHLGLDSKEGAKLVQLFSSAMYSVRTMGLGHHLLQVTYGTDYGQDTAK